jgi:aquaglyceroporin related protein
MAPILGAQAGACFYDAFFYTGSESVFNKPCVSIYFAEQGVI